MNRTLSAILGICLLGLFLVGMVVLISTFLEQLDPSDAGSSPTRFLMVGVLLVGSLACLLAQILLVQRIFTADKPKPTTLIRFTRVPDSPDAASFCAANSAPTKTPEGIPIERFTCGRYQIQRQLGAGGMAIVYLALDPAFDRPVAIKVLPAHLCANAANRERFRREAHAIAALEHAAAVPVYDFGEERGQPFLVMRYLPGGSLQDRLQTPLPLSASVGILRRIIPALAKAHAMGMVHRDIKPGNILFDGEENPYLGDFGLVKLLEGEVSLSQGEFFGTPTYASPEQCRGDQHIDPRTDIYSLTAMFFRMATGFVPYSGNALTVMSKHLHDPVPRLEEYCAGLPAGLQTIIDRGMAKNPGSRYVSVGALAAALDEVVPAEFLADD
jgi:serine/threonine protein kinase